MTTSSPVTAAASARRPLRRPALRVAIAGVAAGTLLVGATGYAASRPGDRSERHGHQRERAAIGTAPGQSSEQRFQQDGVDVSVTVDPARPGPNLVRVDLATPSTGGWHVLVGTTADDEQDRMVVARPRAGRDGLWAEVDLPSGTSTLLVGHGPGQLVPFPVDTGTAG